MNQIIKIGFGLLLSFSLSACQGEENDGETGVGVTQINYTDHAVATVGIAKLKDPNKVPFTEPVRRRNYTYDRASGGPGEDDLPFIDKDSALLLQESHPYSGGGMQCCVDLPKIWQPNMKYLVRIEPDYYTDTTEGHAKEGDTFYDYVVEIPKYTPEQRSTLYILVLPENKIEVVVSDVGPSNPAWAGKTKGAPVPSYEYELKQWEKEEKKLQNYAYPAPRYSDKYYEEYWKSDARFEPEKISGFKDSKDPAYQKFTDDMNLKHEWDRKSNDKDYETQLKQFKGYQDPAFRQFIENDDRESDLFWQKQLADWQKHKPKKPLVQEKK